MFMFVYFLLFWMYLFDPTDRSEPTDRYLLLGQGRDQLGLWLGPREQRRDGTALQRSVIVSLPADVVLVPEVVAADPQAVHPGHEHGGKFGVVAAVPDGLQPLAAHNRVRGEDVKFLLRDGEPRLADISTPGHRALHRGPR